MELEVEAGGQIQVSGRPGFQAAARRCLSRLPCTGFPLFPLACVSELGWCRGQQPGRGISFLPPPGLCDLGLLTHLSELPLPGGWDSASARSNKASHEFLTS